MDDALLTLDIDWAPDCTIEWIARTLVARQVRATWFVTHLSPAVERLRDHPDLFQLGIHPNFLAGSSHGDTTDAVLGHCMGLVPEALTMRSHALVQSPPIWAGSCPRLRSSRICRCTCPTPLISVPWSTASVAAPCVAPAVLLGGR